MTPTTPYEYMMPLGIAKNVLTADGCQDIMTRDWYYCCPPPLCGNDLCCTFVAFFNLLPSGPLWDYWKRKAIEYFQVNEDVSKCPLVKDPTCPSLVLHAIYTVLDPTTAPATLADKIVYVADRRGGMKVESVAERARDTARRHPRYASDIERAIPAATALEKEVFGGLPFAPEELEAHLIA